VFDVLERAARAESTVLIQGESGTGKELAAQAIHAASPRAAGPFVVVDCSALAPSLAESELFGHERGAFTGAVAARTGAFEEASGGTVLLDEIGELPLELQPKLLRALQMRQVRRVGATAYRDIDVRVVASTHRNLARMADEGTFRDDLYYRLAVVVVTLPPLRQRTEDIPLLARELARQIRPNEPVTLDASIVAALAAYAWPGNVRELRNALERLLVLGEAPEGLAPVSDVLAYHDARRRALDAFERSYCRELLETSGGVVARAAERAGLSRQMLHRLLRRHGVEGG
jgi:DNA-binding NtrC family response regulator